MGPSQNRPSVTGETYVTTTQQVAAVVALLAAGFALVVGIVMAISDFPEGLGVLGCLVIALLAAWFAVVNRGVRRILATALAALAVAAAAVLLARNDSWFPLVALLIGVTAWHGAARVAFTVHVRLPAAKRPERPVLFINPWSGGGKAAQVGLAAEADARGIRTVELHRGDDLEKLVHDAVADGADALAAAGGDGTQAIVATAASECNLPYACIPAGTRNHFALDLGVDRDDVVGALDALVDGGERIVDFGEVNGRVFVNNVSLGLYAEAVQSEKYRDAKIRTLLDTAPSVLGHEGSELDLRWHAPDGTTHSSAAVILVSNNPYRLGTAIGSGTRPRMDSGHLGVAVSTVRGKNESTGRRGSGLLLQWATPTFEIDSAGPVPMGIDGEAVVLDPPIRFRIRSSALRVRIAPQHPGASPSALQPDGALEGLRALCTIATGRNHSPRGMRSKVHPGDPRRHEKNAAVRHCFIRPARERVGSPRLRRR